MGGSATGNGLHSRVCGFQGWTWVKGWRHSWAKGRFSVKEAILGNPDQNSPSPFSSSWSTSMSHHRHWQVGRESPGTNFPLLCGPKFGACILFYLVGGASRRRDHQMTMSWTQATGGSSPYPSNVGPSCLPCAQRLHREHSLHIVVWC